ncbi:MAG: R3H domain-containing nucleic acid-binding protein, partial [Patescibacteria group bacterium]
TDLALKVAQKVRRTKKPVILEPMSAYERRFIHLRLAEYPDITTESIGEEPERKVVVRLYP